MINNLFKYLLVIPAIFSVMVGVAVGSSKRGEISVYKKGDVVYVRSFFSKNKDVVCILAKGRNRQINFTATYLVGKKTKPEPDAVKKGLLIHACGDDATPWKINGTYIGGNHGCSSGLEVTSSEHGLTIAAIGTEWADAEGKKFYVVRVVDNDKIWLLSENYGKDGIWSFSGKISGGCLKNTVDGRAFSITAKKYVQIRPACRIKKQEYLANGDRPLADGKVTNCRFLNIVEEYDIIAPDSLVDVLRKNPGRESSLVGAEFESVLNNRITYQFQPRGACVVDYKARADRDFDLDYMGFIQTQQLVQNKFERHGYYVTKTFPFELEGQHFDFANIQDYSKKRKFSLFFKDDNKTLSDKNNLPERFVQLLGSGDKWQVGYAAGYSLISGVTRPEIRAKNCGRALYLAISQKTYPSAIDSKMGRIKKGQEFHCVAYRQYFSPSIASNNATSVYWNRQGNYDVLYADYHKAVAEDTISLPAEISGRNISVVEKTDSIKILSGDTAAQGQIKVSVSGKHGYVVLKLE